MPAHNERHKKDGDKLYNVTYQNRTLQFWASCPFDAREAASVSFGILPKHSHRLTAELAAGVPDTTMEL